MEWKVMKLGSRKNISVFVNGHAVQQLHAMHFFVLLFSLLGLAETSQQLHSLLQISSKAESVCTVKEL